MNAALILTLLGAALIAVVCSPMSPSTCNLWPRRVAILALAGVGLNLALGVGGMVSFGHAAFFRPWRICRRASRAHHAGNYTPFLELAFRDRAATTSMPMHLGARRGGGGGARRRCPIGALSLRTKGVYFIMTTLAFAQMIYYLAISIPTYGGEDGLPIYLRNAFPGLDANDPLIFFAICFALLAVALYLSHRLSESRFGSALAMARINETRLATAGVEPFPIKLTAFVLSAAIVGLAGALFADLNGFVGPSMLSWRRSGEIMIFVILGGVGRLCGPLAGAAMFILLESFVGGWIGAIVDGSAVWLGFEPVGGWESRWALFLGLALLAVVLFARGGLIGLLAGKARHD